jgi:endonuclease/exonuclease/phosphatase (EEP) superfamily protein YafD
LLPLSRHPHWTVRGWDFPRLQILIGLVLTAGARAAWFGFDRPADWLWLAALLGSAVWQARQILPYTPLARRAVQPGERRAGATLRLLIANVRMHNRDFDRLLRLVGERRPDLLLVLEADGRWVEQLRLLEPLLPQALFHPQDNCYGIALMSQFELVEPELRFLVQRDVPSIHSGVRLPCGRLVRLHGLHPRPPEPLREASADARDAELVLVGRELVDHEQSTIVAGDLNDVAWSRTTKLFLNVSGLLDPRRGRGMYNTFPVQVPFMRFPLDHVFHSNDFRLLSLERMPAIGSDHFPVLIELCWDPAAGAQQPQPVPTAEEREEAREKVRWADEVPQEGS